MISVQLRLMYGGNRNQAEQVQHQRVPQGCVQGRVKPLTAAAGILLCLSMIAAIGPKLMQERECNQWDWDVEDAEQDLQHANSTLFDIQESYKSREEKMVESERAYCRGLNGVTPEKLKSTSQMLKSSDPFDRSEASFILDIDIECAILAMNRAKMVRSLDPDLCDTIKAAVQKTEVRLSEQTPLVCYAKQERDAQVQLKRMKDRLAARLEKKPTFCNGRKLKRMH